MSKSADVDLKNKLYEEIAREVEQEVGWMRDAPTIAIWIRKHIKQER